jgi:hypothetical protein
MCYNCGCGNPVDDMGSENNITEHTFEHLAQLLHMSPSEAKLHVYHLLEKQKESTFKEIVHEEPEITEMFVNAAKAWGQSVEEARRQTYTLLQPEVKRFIMKK